MRHQFKFFFVTKKISMRLYIINHFIRKFGIMKYYSWFVNKGYRKFIFPLSLHHLYFLFCHNLIYYEINLYFSRALLICNITSFFSKSYKHKYYLSYICNEIKPAANFQQTEVSEVRWMSLESCLKHIRPYNLEKKEVILQINNALEKYRLIS